MADHFDRFTKRAYRVLALAQSEAKRLNDSYIGTEHLLLGLVLAEGGIAIEILNALNVDLSSIRSRIEGIGGQSQSPVQEKLSLTSQTKRVIELAVDEARSFGYQYIGTEHLLVGLLREGSGAASQILNGMGVSLDKVRTQMQLLPREKSSAPILPASSIASKLPLAVSPIFGIIILTTVIAAYLTYQKILNPGLTVFVFVTGGWIISLCLHEFGHAAVAFLGGDRGVVDKGYLTLNPLKYTHSVLSVILPLVYLALGGIGLPGGAVYINPEAIKSKGMRSLTSAAGPIATGVCAIFLLAPFAMGLIEADSFNHFEFWAGLAFLASLEITALIFNILPIPGLDGFGMITPYLPDNVVSNVRGFGPYTLVIIFILFSNHTFNQGFWSAIMYVNSLFNLDHYLVYEGYRLFQFWTN